MPKKTLPALIGVVHLPALAGAPGAAGKHPAQALQEAGARAIAEARAFQSAGFQGIVLENFGDTPFFKERVPTETVACLSVVAAAVREATSLPIGINVLRNDARAALGIAAVTGCDFIRVNVLSGVAATDQGLIEGSAAELIRERDRLGADIKILADAHVKHARSLSSFDIALAVEELALRSRADGVIVTGATTGRAVDMVELKRASESAKHHGVSLFIGSGVSAENVRDLKPYIHGVIVSSALRKGGRAGAALDGKKLREFAKLFRKSSGKR